eukprot:TRINITY_DN2721_c4_g1_i1.p1 TRINITY_DN2721_c4_g1~~TRINITY_DN2721_c4_g1_i1.p1  ORF type:complete len:237 (+),score=37.47 TRINITY_DN2721_c4_g1_i1:78-788(+)
MPVESHHSYEDEGAPMDLDDLCESYLGVRPSDSLTQLQASVETLISSPREMLSSPRLSPRTEASQALTKAGSGEDAEQGSVEESRGLLRESSQQVDRPQDVSDNIDEDAARARRLSLGRGALAAGALFFVVTFAWFFGREILLPGGNSQFAGLGEKQELPLPPLMPGFERCGVSQCPRGDKCCNGLCGVPYSSCCDGKILCQPGGTCCNGLCCGPRAVCCNGICLAPGANCTGFIG